MTPVEMLIDLIDFNADWLKQALAEMSDELLIWRPDPGANNINNTVWHVSRMLDIFQTHFLDGKEQEAELYFADGWAEKLGYDSRGIGMMGMGSLIGYTAEEMHAIPTFAMEPLLAYFDATHETTKAYLRALPEDGLEQMRKGFSAEQPVYAWVRHVYLDEVRHLGEILAIQSMWQRQQGN